MKYAIAALFALFTTTASAGHEGWYGPYHRPQRMWHPHYGWVVPAIIGGVVTYEIVKAQQPPPQVIVEQQPAPVLTTVCTEWKEIMTADGKVYRERSCTTK
mgnify:CR=1 FL=1